MWNHLNSPAQIIPATLFTQNILVNPAGSEVIFLRHPSADEALIVAKIEIGFGTIVGDKDLTVLEWTHGTGIDIDVGIKFQHGDLQATCLQNGSK